MAHVHLKASARREQQSNQESFLHQLNYTSSELTKQMTTLRGGARQPATPFSKSRTIQGGGQFLLSKFSQQPQGSNAGGLGFEAPYARTSGRAIATSHASKSGAVLKSMAVGKNQGSYFPPVPANNGSHHYTKNQQSQRSAYRGCHRVYESQVFSRASTQGQSAKFAPTRTSDALRLRSEYCNQAQKPESNSILDQYTNNNMTAPSPLGQNSPFDAARKKVAYGGKPTAQSSFTTTLASLSMVRQKHPQIQPLAEQYHVETAPFGEKPISPPLRVRKIKSNKAVRSYIRQQSTALLSRRHSPPTSRGSHSPSPSLLSAQCPLPQTIHQPAQAFAAPANVVPSTARTPNPLPTPPPRTSSHVPTVTQPTCSTLQSWSGAVDTPMDQQSANFKKNGMAAASQVAAPSASAPGTQKRKRKERSSVELLAIMNNYGNKLRCQLDKLENNIDLVHVRQNQIQRGEIFYHGGLHHRRLSTGILENLDGQRRGHSRAEGAKKSVKFNIDEQEEEERQQKLKKRRILRPRKLEAKPIIHIRQRHTQKQASPPQASENETQETQEQELTCQ